VAALRAKAVALAFIPREAGPGQGVWRYQAPAASPVCPAAGPAARPREEAAERARARAVAVAGWLQEVARA